MRNILGCRKHFQELRFAWKARQTFISSFQNFQGNIFFVLIKFGELLWCQILLTFLSFAKFYSTWRCCTNFCPEFCLLLYIVRIFVALAQLVSILIYYLGLNGVSFNCTMIIYRYSAFIPPLGIIPPLEPAIIFKSGLTT